MYSTEKILAYLNNELNENQKKAFEKKIEQNKILKDEVAFYQDLLLTGEVFGQEGIRKQLDKVWDKNNTQRRKKNKRSSFLFFTPVGRYAAIVVLLIIAGVLWFTHEFFKARSIKNNPKHYATLLSKARQKYKNEYIIWIDMQLEGTKNKERGLSIAETNPSIDTLIFSRTKVLFEWKESGLGKSFLLEIFTRKNESDPIKIVLPPNAKHYRKKMLPGLYYWRLSLLDKNIPEEVLKQGRFFVVDF